MKIYDIIRLANDNMWRNKSRTLLTILAIFIGAFTIMLTTGINSGVNSYIDRQVDSVGAEDYLQIMPKSTSETIMGMMSGNSVEVKEYEPSTTDASGTSTITDDDIKKIDSIDGIHNVKPYKIILSDYITATGDNIKKYDLTVSVLPTDSIRLDLAAGRNVDLNSDEAEMVLPDKYLDVLGFKSAEDAIGKKVLIGATSTMTKKQDEVKVTVVGVQNQSIVGFGSAWINDAAGLAIEDVMMAGLPDEYRDQTRSVVAQIDNSYLTDEGISRIKDDLSDIGYAAMTTDDTVAMIRTFFNAITTVLTIFGAIALVAASIGIINTLFMAVQERTREIGLMKSMGLSRAKIFGMFSIEAISLGFWGGIFALICTYIAQAIVNPLATDTFLSGLPGFSLIEINPLWMVIIILVVMMIAFLSGTLPARRAAGKDPIEALRYE